jgi:hypothetical protein
VSEDEVNAILLAASPSIGFYAIAIVAPRAAAFAPLRVGLGPAVGAGTCGP